MTDTNRVTKGRVLSGMRPTGKLHLGNYVGALRNWVNLQNEYDCFFFIADWHALTSDYADPSLIAQNTIEVLLDWIAAGLDPDKCTMFVQSHVLQHSELHVLLSMITPLSWLERVPTYKEQRENIRDKDLGTYGFLGYPVLQSADILLYGVQTRQLYVPVGEDQVAHVELTREIARRFNSLYNRGGFGVQFGESFGGVNVSPTKALLVEPEAMLTAAARMRGSDKRKMSKSYNNFILLSDDAKVIRDKVKRFSTDRVRREDPGNPEACPVGDLHNSFSDPQTVFKVDQGCRTASISCEECKTWAANNLIHSLAPMQERRRATAQRPEQLYSILENGALKARLEAEQTMQKARAALSLLTLSDLSVGPGRIIATRQALTIPNPQMIQAMQHDERGGIRRMLWLEKVSSQIHLRDVGHRTFVTKKGRRVGIPTSGERHGCWQFKIGDRHYDLLVLLCQTQGDEILDFVLPPAVLRSFWLKLSRVDKKQVEFEVKKIEGHFFFVVPNQGIVPIDEYQSDYAQLQ